MADGVHERVRLFQLRKNGELLLRLEPPMDGDGLEPTAPQAWLWIADAFWEQAPEQPIHTAEFVAACHDIAPLFDTLVRPGEDCTLIGWVPDHRDVMGDGRGAVRGPGRTVAAYAVQLIARGFEDIVVLDPDDSGLLIVDQDDEKGPGIVTVDRYQLRGE